MAILMYCVASLVKRFLACEPGALVQLQVFTDTTQSRGSKGLVQKHAASLQLQVLDLHERIVLWRTQAGVYRARTIVARRLGYCDLVSMQCWTHCCSVIKREEYALDLLREQVKQLASV